MKRTFVLPLIIGSVCVFVLLIYFLVGVYIGYKQKPSPEEFLKNAFLRDRAGDTEKVSPEDIELPPLETLDPPEDIINYKIKRIRFGEQVRLEVEIPHLLSEEQIKDLTKSLRKLYCSEATLITINYTHYNIDTFHMETVAEYSYVEPDFENLEYYSTTAGISEYSRDDSGSWNDKGTKLYIKGRYTEAIQCYDKAIEIEPEDVKAKAWYNKGTVLDYVMGRYAEAIECYDKAIEIEPNFDAAWSNKGRALYELKRYDEAKGCFKRALELDPSSDHIGHMLKRIQRESH